jgi:hypothetical protein
LNAKFNLKLVKGLLSNAQAISQVIHALEDGGGAA